MLKPLVSVVTITYGHENFIAQAINGVLMQECDFEVELIIANDCSPDKTDEVIKEIIKNHPKASWNKYIKHEKNIGMMPNFIFALKEAQGKYIALCEGDDYWIDPYKLQKQVDFLEANEEYGLVHTQLEYKFGNSKESIVSKTARRKNKFEDLIKHNSIATLTTCIRKKLVLNYFEQVDPINKNWVAGDLPMWLWISLYSKIYFLDEVTSMYRVVAGSVSNTLTSEKYFEFIKSRRSIKEYFINNYQPNEDLLQFVAEDFYKDAEYHVLKLRDKQVINEIGNYFYSKKKKMFLTLYFVMMEKIFNYKLLYQFWFNVYRVYYKFIKKHYKYEQ
jgi:glycosyltransferase involved in cell wall biosynthesis